MSMERPEGFFVPLCAAQRYRKTVMGSGAFRTDCGGGLPEAQFAFVVGISDKGSCAKRGGDQAYCCDGYETDTCRRHAIAPDYFVPECSAAHDQQRQHGRKRKVHSVFEQRVSDGDEAGCR